MENANEWDDADSLQVVGEDAVADVNLNILTSILVMMEEMIVEMGERAIGKYQRPDFDGIKQKKETLLEDISRWKKFKPIPVQTEAYYGTSEVNRRRTEAFEEICSMQLSDGNRCMFEKMRLRY